MKTSSIQPKILFYADLIKVLEKDIATAFIDRINNGKSIKRIYARPDFYAVLKRSTIEDEVCLGISIIKEKNLPWLYFIEYD